MKISVIINILFYTFFCIKLSAQSSMNLSDSLINFSQSTYQQDLAFYKQTAFAKEIERTTLFIVNEKYWIDSEKGFAIMKNKEYDEISIKKESETLRWGKKYKANYKTVVQMKLNKAQLLKYKTFLRPFKPKK